MQAWILIHDLLLVTVIVALAMAWWVDRSELAAELNRLRKMHGERWLLQYDATKAFYVGDDNSTSPQSAQTVTQAFS